MKFVFPALFARVFVATFATIFVPCLRVPRGFLFCRTFRHTAKHHVGECKDLAVPRFPRTDVKHQVGHSKFNFQRASKTKLSQVTFKDKF